MHVVIAGGHGKIARRLARLLTAHGDAVTSIVRRPDHVPELAAEGTRAVLLDLEQASVADAAVALADADAVVFAAGAGPGSGTARKDSVDRAAAVLLADAAEQAGVRRFVQVSSMGTDSVRDGATPDGVDEVFLAYLRAKAAAEDDLATRTQLDWTILRPGRLTDEGGTRHVTLLPSAPRGPVPRDDVAAVLLALLQAPQTAGMTLELVTGDTPVDSAVDALTRKDDA